MNTLKTIGPSFHAELLVAGISDLPISWSSTGVTWDETAMSSTQQATLIDVINAHVAETEAPAPVPDRVTRRQLMMQLEIDGIYDEVQEWITKQERIIRIAFAESGTFVRTDEMLQQGFAALNFPPERVDQFFTDAASLL